jgi:putative transposase
MHGVKADAGARPAGCHSREAGSHHDQRQVGSLPLDQVNRQFLAPAPDRLWLSDFTYVATWAGFVYVAFVIDAYARRIVGWRASRTAHAGFVLDAPEQVLHDRRPLHGGGLIYHSDGGSQYVSIKYTERLAQAGIEPSVGSVGDSFDNALAETINGLYKGEVIHRRGPCSSQSGIFRRPKPRQITTPHWMNRPWPHNLYQTASGKAGAVHDGLLGFKGAEREVATRADTGVRSR